MTTPVLPQRGVSQSAAEGPILIPLLCPNCQFPVPALPDETGWVCGQCGQASLLDEAERGGLRPIAIQYAAGIPANAKGRPFWVCAGAVALRRDTYSGDRTREAEGFWGSGRYFYIPAFKCALEQLVSLGVDLVGRQPALQPGQPAWFLPITVGLEDVRPLAEFIVLGVEANRSDKLKSLSFNLNLSEPQLWILP
jgi:hypothetical protein